MRDLYYFSMFDGSLEQKGTHNARLRIIQTEDKLEYLEEAGKVMTAASIGFSIKPKLNNQGFVNSKPQLMLSTLSHPKLGTIRDRIYLNGRKTIDPHVLTFLDERSFTIMFMADGSSSQSVKKNYSPQYYIHTNSFTYAENLLLKKAIKEKLNLEFNVVAHKHLWELRLQASSVERMRKVISEHLLDCYAYKFK